MLESVEYLKFRLSIKSTLQLWPNPTHFFWVQPGWGCSSGSKFGSNSGWVGGVHLTALPWTLFKKKDSSFHTVVTSHHGPPGNDLVLLTTLLPKWQQHLLLLLGRQTLELRQTWNNFEFEKFAVFDGLLNNIAKVNLKFKCWMNSNLQVYIFFLLCPVYLLWSIKNHLVGLSKVLLVKSSNRLFYGI